MRGNCSLERACVRYIKHCSLAGSDSCFLQELCFDLVDKAALLQQPQLPGQEAALLCGAPLRTAGACVWGPLGVGHSAASTADRLFPAKWCQRSTRLSRVTLQKNLCKMWCLCCRMVVCRSRLLVATCAKAFQLLTGEVASGCRDLSVTLLTL